MCSSGRKSKFKPVRVDFVFPDAWGSPEFKTIYLDSLNYVYKINK